MAKPNYSYAKRQRELAKQQKKELKRKQKAEAQQAAQADGDEEQSSELPNQENNSDE